MAKSAKAKKERKIAKLKPILRLSRKLKKAQNETRTEFKTRKIVMKEQLGDRPNVVVVDKKNVSVKDLISRLNHHNKIVKKDAIDRIKDVIQSHKPNVYGSFVPGIIKGLGPCLFDLTKSVRQSSIKCINVLIQLCRNKVEPFLDFLVSYASCAMVHIDIQVQHDSLMIVDSIRILLPLMKADTVNLLLSNFLGLVCRKIKGSDGNHWEDMDSSALMFNPDNMLTHIKFRLKLLTSLEMFLSTILKHYGKSNTSSLSPWEIILHNSFPSIGNEGNDLCRINIFINAPEAKSFVKSVLDILNITWVEASVGVNKKFQERLCEQNVYEVIVSILNYLPQIVAICDANDPTEGNWFGSAISRDFLDLIFGGFPYDTFRESTDGTVSTSEVAWNLNLPIATLAINLSERDPALKIRIIDAFCGLFLNQDINKEHNMDKMVHICCQLLQPDLNIPVAKQEALLASALKWFEYHGDEKAHSDLCTKSRQLMLALPLRAAEMDCSYLRGSAILMAWVKQLVRESDQDDPAIKKTLIQLKLRNLPRFRQAVIQCREATPTLNHTETSLIEI